MQFINNHYIKTSNQLVTHSFFVQEVINFAYFIEIILSDRKARIFVFVFK